MEPRQSESDRLRIELHDPHNADGEGIMYAKRDDDPSQLFDLLTMVAANHERLWKAYVELRGGPPPVSNR